MVCPDHSSLALAEEDDDDDVGVGMATLFRARSRKFFGTTKNSTLAIPRLIMPITRYCMHKPQNMQRPKNEEESSVVTRIINYNYIRINWLNIVVVAAAGSSLTRVLVVDKM